MADVTIASFHLHNADKMTDARRREIARWLRRQANFIVKEGAEDRIAPRFRARYMLPEEVITAEQTEAETITSTPPQTPAGAARG